MANIIDLGIVVATRGVADLTMRDPDWKEWVEKCLIRYTACDWGDTSDEDKKLNDEALDPHDPGRIVAKYKHDTSDIFIITEWARSVTTILFPSEY